MNKKSNDLVILRGVHPHEVTAFYLAKEVANALRQNGRNTDLITIPYDYSLNYLVDHHPEIVLKYFEFMKCPRELDESKKSELDDEFIKADPSGRRIGIWDENLVSIYPSQLIDQIRRKHGEKPIVDFHNFPSNIPIDLEDSNLAASFTLSKGYNGFIQRESYPKDCYTIEIPAFFRPLPKSILKRRKRTIKVIKECEENPSVYLDYLEGVADFARSNEEGLTNGETVKTISEVIEDVIRGN